MAQYLFSGGGTLGPVTPLLAVMEELRARQPEAEFLFVGTPEGPERRLVEAGGFSFTSLKAPKLRRYFDWRNLFIPFTLTWSVAKAMALMTLERPDVVIGAGGYVSVPVGIAAKILGTKLLIHQQDVTPSLSNRLLAGLADAVTCAFEVSRRDFPASKTEVIGNPVRSIFERGDRAQGLKALGFSGERPIVMAVGGGTGSRFMNELVILGSPLWTDFCDLVHVTGLEKAPVRPPTLEHPERYRLVEFLGAEIAHYYAAADVVITRAGLGTLTELATLSKPAILIPLADTQQETNAAYIVERGGARMFRELDLTPEQLVTFTRELLQRPDDMARLGNILHGLFSGQARAALADRILKLAEGKKKS